MKKNNWFAIIVMILLCTACRIGEKETEETQYTVSFHANGGNGTVPNSIKGKAGESKLLPNGNSLSSQGAAFGGWCDNSNGTEIVYNAGSLFTVRTEDTILHAVWNPDSPIITVFSVTVSPSTPSVQKGRSQQFFAWVEGENSPAQTIIWNISGGGVGTSISTDGLLTIATNESAASIIVMATSTVNINKSGTTTVTVSPASPIPPIKTIYYRGFNSSFDFSIKNGASRDELITSDFDITVLKNAGYTKFVLTLRFDTKNELLVNVGSRLYASFWKGLAPSITQKDKYGEKNWTPALNRWEAKEFIQEINLTDFSNQLTIRWSTSANASYKVGTRSITIEAKK
ncbi:MAG: InlB B-repeat-containing protein [Treponema sp.]|nr:InlB B-repeat-containing protein [Treponema sp.]